METSARSRRAAAPQEDAAPRGGGCQGVLLLAVALLGACCAYLSLEGASTSTSNIGDVRAEDFLSYGPIDVVYTWVNGTDPRWKEEKEFWHKHWIASLTGQPLPVWGEQATVKGQDDSNSDNRFRDNEELRYSLRSLEKYAPWVRHIYVVTDGQIPSWLDISSPKLSIVKHRDIFTNASHLPVFSSPAIEWNLDNIPGLSDMFLYFNDDVFLGAPVRPEDFVSQAGVQKAYFAWEIPLCANRCWETSLANGRCDKECNVTACDFDMGDCGCDVDPLDGSVSCDADKVASIKEQTPKPPRIADHICQGTCQYKWLGNGFCDRTCNVSSCAFDGGDCRVLLPLKDRHKRRNRHKKHTNKAGKLPDLEPEDEGLSPLVLDLFSADVAMNHTLVQVPLDVNATYLNLTEAFGGANGSVLSATHDNEALIRFASVYEKELVLLLVLGRDADANPLTSSAQISVVGKDAAGNPVHLDFSLIRGKHLMSSGLEEVEDDEDDEWVAGGASTFQNSSIRPSHIRLPFGFRQATFQTLEPSSSDAAVQDGDEEHVESSTVASEQEGGPSETDVAALVAETVPQIEVFLPFNVTGKKLDDGDVLSLGWYLELRLHDEVEDLAWSDHQFCRLKLPKKATSVAMEQAGPQRIEAADNQKVVEVGVTAASALREDGLEGGNTFSFDVLQGEENVQQPEANQGEEEVEVEQQVPASDQAELEEHPEEVEEEDELPPCRLVEDQRGILVTLRVPTHHARAVLTAMGTSERDEDSEDGDTRVPSASSAFSGSAPSSGDNVDGANTASELVETATRPQVTDGQLCFYDSDRADPWRYRYCFALAMAHFHEAVVEAVHQPTLYAKLHPPKRPVVYTPYNGDDPALLELADRCIDTTRRLGGMRPRVCYLNEVPVPRAEVDTATTKPDPKVEKEAEGRRLACEARRRRMAQRDVLEAEKQEALASGGVVNNLVERLKAALGLSTLEPADESLEDVEYEDVCTPATLAELEDEERKKQEKEKKPAVTSKSAQALLSKDTFGDSLRFVNKLYNRAFGKASERRRVPSHMPFLLQKQLIREIKEHWDTETQATSAHRFRHPEDMQFSFSYFHYAINRAKLHPHTLAEVWREYLDANRNGILDENEVLTAASLAHGDAPPEDFVNQVRDCIQPAKREKVRELPTAEGTLRLSETLTPYITLEHLEQCRNVSDALVRNVRYEPTVELMTEAEVTFHMLSDNFKFAWKQMLGTRARRTKFVCINDDMRFPSAAVSQILHELFLSIWPKRSQFELPYHLKNRYAHIDEYAAAQTRRQLAAAMVAVVLLLLALVFRAELKALFGFQDIARARAASASQLSNDYQQAEQEDQDQQEQLQQQQEANLSPRKKKKPTRKASA